jgi:hypothetical protein
LGVITLVLSLSLLAGSGADPSQWRFVYRDGSVGAASGAPQLSAADLARLRSAWEWSTVQPPRQAQPAEIARPDRAGSTAVGSKHLEIRVVRKARVPPPPDLRVIAAPIEMWAEVPEGSLPSWPVPAGGRLVLPVDGVHRWRVRAAGTGEGSWWLDAKPNVAAVALESVPAGGFDLAVQDEKGTPLAAIGGYVKEGAKGLKDSRAWAGVRGAGRLSVPGLPDGQEVTLEVIESGYEPAVLRGWPSALPRQLRLHAGAVLSGRVTDAAGRALPGVAVEVEAWAGPQSTLLMKYTARTAASGEWTVKGVPHGQLALTLRKHGYVPHVERLVVSAGAAGAPRAAGNTDLGRRQLDRGGQLTVVVRDAAGPVAGARVEAGPGLKGTTDPTGTAVFDGVPPSGLLLKAEASRHQSGTLRINPPFPEPAVLTLPRAFTVTGRFVDGSGAPVTGGVAQVEMPTCRNSEHLAEDGSFSLTLPPGSAATLVLRAPQVRELRTGLAAGTAGEVRDLGNLTPPPGLDVTGRVVSAQDLAPVAGASVWLPRPGPGGPVVAWANRDLLETSTDETGAFRLSGLAQGGSRLRIDAAGFARAQADVGAVDPGASGGVVDLGDIPVSPGTRLHVLVRPTGRSTDDSLEGATARVDLGNQWIDPDMLQAEVQGGEAVVPNVPAGLVTVSVLAANKLACDKQVTVAGEPDLDVDCTRKAMTVTGIVKLGTAPAVAGALLWQPAGGDTAGVGDTQINTTTTGAGLRQQQVFGLGRPQVTTPVDQGSFQTQDLTAGAWSVAWESPSGSLSAAVTAQVPDLDTFATELDFPGLSVTGTVTTQDGKAAPAARVRELTSGNFALAAQDGTFTLAGLPPGPATLQAQQDQLLSRLLRLDLPADGNLDPVKLVVGDNSTKIDVQVTTAGGVPLGGAFVFVQQQGGGTLLLTTGADGTTSTTIDGAEPPAVRVAAYATGVWTFGAWTPWDTAQQGLALASDPNGHGTLVVTSTQVAAVRLLSADGWDLSWLHQLLGLPLQAAPANPLEIQGLPAGAYSLGKGGAAAAVTVNVPDQGATEVKLNQ